MKTMYGRLERVFGVRTTMRSSELERAGIRREYVARACRNEFLVREARGLYGLAGGEITEHHSLAVAIRRVPHATVCLLTALSFHDLTTQSPPDIWLAVGPRARFAAPDARRGLRLVRMADVLRAAGVEMHVIEGTAVPVTGMAKTVVDCFRYRNKVGLDVALEALRDYLHRERSGVEALTEYAKLCRVERVMRPYLEALV